MSPDVNVTFSTGATMINSLTSAEAFTLSGGTLTIDAASSLNINFTLSGGTLSGVGDLTINGAMNWTGSSTMTGESSDNAFKITPAGVITQIIDNTGDGAGHNFDLPYGIAVDASRNVYVTGFGTHNAFKLAPDADGDGTPDEIDECDNDPNKTSPGACGCGKSDADANANGMPDCLDQPPAMPQNGCGCAPGLFPTAGLMASMILVVGWRTHRRRLRVIAARSKALA